MRHPHSRTALPRTTTTTPHTCPNPTPPFVWFQYASRSRLAIGYLVILLSPLVSVIGSALVTASDAIETTIPAIPLNWSIVIRDAVRDNLLPRPHHSCMPTGPVGHAAYLIQRAVSHLLRLSTMSMILAACFVCSILRCVRRTMFQHWTSRQNLACVLTTFTSWLSMLHSFCLHACTAVASRQRAFFARSSDARSRRSKAATPSGVKDKMTKMRSTYTVSDLSQRVKSLLDVSEALRERVESAELRASEASNTVSDLNQKVKSLMDVSETLRERAEAAELRASEASNVLQSAERRVIEAERKVDELKRRAAKADERAAQTLSLTEHRASKAEESAKEWRVAGQKAKAASKWVESQLEKAQLEVEKQAIEMKNMQSALAVAQAIEDEMTNRIRDLEAELDGEVESSDEMGMDDEVSFTVPTICAEQLGDDDDLPGDTCEPESSAEVVRMDAVLFLTVPTISAEDAGRLGGDDDLPGVLYEPDDESSHYPFIVLGPLPPAFDGVKKVINADEIGMGRCGKGEGDERKIRKVLGELQVNV